MATTRFPEKSPVVTLTRPSPSIWVVEIHNPPDNRLTKTVISHGLVPALDTVEREWRHARAAASKAGEEADKTAGSGALVLVGLRGQDKFFSNGFDFPTIVADPTWFTDVYDPFIVRLLTFPLPTVAAINGHCFAAGFMTALACDYRVMTDGSKRNAWMCMNEIDFGANWPPVIASLAQHKIRNPSIIRKVGLEGHRFTPPEALKAELVDAIVPGNTEAVLEHAIALAKTKSAKAKSGAWGLIKGQIYRELIETTKRSFITWNPALDETAAKIRLAKL